MEKFLFWSEMVSSATLFLSAICSFRVESSITFAADHLVAVVLLRQNSQRWFNYTSPQSEHQMKGGLLLYVVVIQGPVIIKLLTIKNEALLVCGNSFFVLKLLLDNINGVCGFDLQSDGFPNQGLDENLHSS